jgi:HSP20 family protein
MWNMIPWNRNDSGSGLMTAEPFEREFSRIRNEFDSLMQRMFSSGIGFDDNDSRLRHGLDTDENDTHHIVRVGAPGFDAKDFDVHVSGNQLVIKAERKDSQEGKEGSRQFFGKVQRVISLPQGVKSDEVEASYRNGLLEVKIPKGKEAQVKKIAVKTS